MFERLEKIVRMKDLTFSLYQFPIILYIWYGDLAHDIVDVLKKNNYMGLRESWELIDVEDIQGQTICEWGCNVGSTSHNILNLKPKSLYSFDISPKAIEFCHYFNKIGMYKDWYPEIGNIKHIEQSCDVSIWEDPHTDIDDEIKLMLKNIVKNTNKIIYLLECDNIEDILTDMFGESLVKIREDSWKVVL